MFWLYEIWYENWFWPNKCEYYPSFADDVVIVFKPVNKTWGLVTLSSTIVAYNHVLWAAKINDSYERTWWNESDVKCIERCYIFGTKYMLFYTNFDEIAYIWYIIDITIKEVVVNENISQMSVRTNHFKKVNLFHPTIHGYWNIWHTYMPKAYIYSPLRTKIRSLFHVMPCRLFGAFY